tara:strand:+ start:798 stop:1145 length:348 start_codon:yes stop_codon:yes gene_type:complete
MYVLLIKKENHIADIEAIYVLEKLLLKKEVWILKILENELLKNNNSKILIIKENRLIIGYYNSRIHEQEYHILNIEVTALRQRGGIANIMIKESLISIPSNSSVFLQVNKCNFLR